MKISTLLLLAGITLGAGSVMAAQPCDNQTLYQTGWFVPPSAGIFSRNPLPVLGLGTGSILGSKEFPNGVLMIQWPTSPTNYLLLPMDYPVPDAIASGAIKAAQEAKKLMVTFCIDPGNTNVRIIDYVLFGT